MSKYQIVQWSRKSWTGQPLFGLSPPSPDLCLEGVWGKFYDKSGLTWSFKFSRNSTIRRHCMWTAQETLKVLKNFENSEKEAMTATAITKETLERIAEENHWTTKLGKYLYTK